MCSSSLPGSFLHTLKMFLKHLCHVKNLFCLSVQTGMGCDPMEIQWRPCEWMQWEGTYRLCTYWWIFSRSPLVSQRSLFIYIKLYGVTMSYIRIQVFNKANNLTLIQRELGNTSPIPLPEKFPLVAWAYLVRQFWKGIFVSLFKYSL